MPTPPGSSVAGEQRTADAADAADDRDPDDGDRGDHVELGRENGGPLEGQQDAGERRERRGEGEGVELPANTLTPRAAAARSLDRTASSRRPTRPRRRFATATALSVNAGERHQPVPVGVHDRAENLEPKIDGLPTLMPVSPPANWKSLRTRLNRTMPMPSVAMARLMPRVRSAGSATSTPTSAAAAIAPTRAGRKPSGGAGDEGRGEVPVGEHVLGQRHLPGVAGDHRDRQGVRIANAIVPSAPAPTRGPTTRRRSRRRTRRSPGPPARPGCGRPPRRAAVQQHGLRSGSEHPRTRYATMTMKGTPSPQPVTLR